jgi:hypothetical protein
MWSRLKNRLTAWVEQSQRREIARLRQETMQLTEELERETGKPIQLAAEGRRLLAEKATGIDPETLKQILVLAPEDLTTAEPQTDSTENRQLKAA